MGKNKGLFLFIFELLIIDFVRLLINVILIRLNYKLIIFSGCADNPNINTTTTDNHNINTTVYHSHMCVHVTVVCEVSHIEHAPYNSVLLSKFLLVFLLSFGSCFLRYSADQISGMKPSFTFGRGWDQIPLSSCGNI